MLVNIRSLRALLDAKKTKEQRAAALKLTNNAQCTPFYMACSKSGCDDIMHYILDLCPQSLYMQASKNSYPMHAASQGRNLGAAKILLDRDPLSMSYKRIDGMYPFHMMLRDETPPPEDFLRFMLKHSSHVMNEGPLELKPLRVALEKNYPDNLTRLILNACPTQNIELYHNLNWQFRREAVLASYLSGFPAFEEGSPDASDEDRSEVGMLPTATLNWALTIEELAAVNILAALRTYNIDCWKLVLAFL